MKRCATDDRAAVAARWERAKDILDAILDLAPSERSALLDRSCAGDTALRQEVESLLVFEGSLDDFLTTPIFTLHGGGYDEQEDPNLGRVVGPYRLVQPLGRGGMGSVYLAERCDGQFEHTVALKLIKRGMDTDEILRRFRLERQILAGLVNEHIARFYDGGTTDDGLPYFVMEYVEGERIDRYCDARRLTVTERLRLFHAVCKAVQAAHQNLIVHRDLKPANILITAGDRPKLLDFGIAKLLAPEVGGGPASASGAPSILGRLALTPGYASPEQLREEPITTASDVYSLGVLLYELLTGSRPLDLRTSRPEVWEQAIAEGEPPRPSTAVCRPREVRLASGDTLTLTPQAVAEVRDGDPGKLRRRLAGDLDTIVMTALASDRKSRYASAEQLAEDIRRHLEGLPVHARPSTAAYRAGKFVRRHPGKMAAAAAALLFLSGFAVTMAAQRERIAAERDRAEAVTRYLVEVFERADPGRARGEEITVREALGRGVAEIDAALESQPLTRATLLDAVGRVYDSLALYDEARLLLEEALRVRRQELGEDHPAVAASLQSLAQLRMRQRDVEGVEAMLRQAAAITRRHDGAGALEHAAALHNLGSFLLEYGANEHEHEALELLHRALAIKERRLGPDDPDVAFTLAVLGDWSRRRGDLAAAEQRFRRVLTIRRAEYGEQVHPELATAVNNLAVVLAERGESDVARPLYLENLEMRRKLYGEKDPRYAVALNNLGYFLQAAGDPVAAEPRYRQALAILRDSFGEDDLRVATARRNLAAALAALGDYAGCEREARAALGVHDRNPPAEAWRRADVESVLGGCLVGLGRREEAEPLLVDSLATIVEARGEEAPQAREARARLARFEKALANSISSAGAKRQPSGQ